MELLTPEEIAWLRQQRKSELEAAEAFRPGGPFTQMLVRLGLADPATGAPWPGGTVLDSRGRVIGRTDPATGEWLERGLGRPTGAGGTSGNLRPQTPVGIEVAGIMSRNPTWGGLEEDAIRVGLGGRPRPVRRPQGARGFGPARRSRMMPDGGWQGQAQRQRPNPGNAWRNVAAAMMVQPKRRVPRWPGIAGGFVA